jgi:hypothetical protein
MVSVSPERWIELDELHRGGRYRHEFAASWANGVRFLEATTGLRHRRPIIIEWRGSHKQPGDEPVPADLRIDHVFLVSCKYLSKIVSNTSPAAVFDRLLAGGHAGRSADWYADAAPHAYETLYRACVDFLGDTDMPETVLDLSSFSRGAIKARLGSGRWPPALRAPARAFSSAISVASADRWTSALRDSDPERALWRLLRIGGAPYFVLGSSPHGALRLRVGTAWDWRLHYQLLAFDVVPCVSEQPVVRWQARVRSKRSRDEHLVEGHVEVRWSHGKFAGPPEAKVYLDTPHHLVPGYWPLA